MSTRSYFGSPCYPNINKNDSFKVVELPSFKLTAQQQNGKIEVIVEDPSGKIVKPDVKSSSGVYNATFLPERTGDFLVSIRVDDTDIDGSPFYVKVFDPSKILVKDIKAGFVSQVSSFNVDTEGLGEGPLTITIVNLKTNKILPAQIAQDAGRPQVFHVQWMPVEAGFYRIHVQFANVEATGSPYTVEVIDPSLTTVVGLAPRSLISVAKNFVFTIKTSSNAVSLQDLKVSITDPSEVNVQPRIIDLRNGSANVEFVPVVAGDHKIDISYFGQVIKGSPFHFKTFDSSRVKILNWKTTSLMSKDAVFDVDISKAGPGELDISVSGGEAPYKIKEKDKGKYQVTFTPKQPGLLTFNFLFNKVKILGGPWTCNVYGPPTVVVSGSGVQTNPLIPVDLTTTFDVKITGPNDGDVAVKVTGPNNEVLPSQLVSSINSLYKFQYTPTSAGVYQVEILLDGSPVSGSPFSAKAYSPGSVIIGDVGNAVVGMTVDVPVDTSQAGDGQLEVSVENGAIPNNVTQSSKGHFSATFVPREAKGHQVVVKFNGQQVKGSPLTINVLDLSRIQLVNGDYKVPVNKPCVVKLSTSGAGNGKFSAVARAPSGAEMVPHLKETNKRALDVEFTPKEIGIYEVEVSLEGRSIPINPIPVSVYDISKIRVREIQNGLVQRQMKILVESGDPGEGDLKFSVFGPTGSTLNNQIEQNTPNSYSVTFVPVQQGSHRLVVTFNDESISGSPFNFNVYNIDGISVSGRALDGFPCNKSTSFLISSADQLQASNCEVKITDPSMKVVPVKLMDVSSGAVKAEFTGMMPGDYKIDVKCYGQAVPQSPFSAKGSDISKVSISPISTAVVGIVASFSINVKDAGEGTLEIGITGPQGQQVANSVSPMGPGQFTVSFTPMFQGPHSASITFNEESVQGSPFTISVCDPSKIFARGEGLDLVRSNKPTGFIITSPGIRERDLNVRITGPKNVDVRYRMGEQGEGAYRVEYTPTVPGDYMIEIEAYGRAINYSPFGAKCWDAGRVTTTKISSGRVGVQSSFNIDASSAGEGSMEISVSGPSGQSVPNNLVPLGPGLFVISFLPVESGMHKASITFNQENVAGSPFMFNVIDLGKAAAKGEGLGLVKANTNTSFSITAPGAVEKDVEVYIYAPNGKEVPYKMYDTSPSNFRVDFTPSVAGDHRVDINYFGLALSGSPYVSKVWDSSKVLVTNIKSGRVGLPNVFNVDANEAGEGTMEIGVTSPSGQNIHNNVVPAGAGKFEVSSVPQEPGLYKIGVSFNKENVPGSPFTFLATDVSKVTVRGDGIGVVKCGMPTSFNVFAPVAQQKDVAISVTGPDNNEVMTRINETTSNTFKVEYTPSVVGTHHVKVMYFGQSVPSSPFPVKVWDPTKASLTVPNVCKVGKQTSLRIDAQRAGDGSAEVAVAQPSGRQLPCSLSSLGNGCYEAVFVTTETGMHRVTGLFNKENINGSPSSMLSIDPSKVVVRGDGLNKVPCNLPAFFNFKAPAATSSDVHVKISGPDYRDVTSRVIENGEQFNVEYVPTKPGDYVIDVSYFGEVVSGSPFVSKAFNSSAVQLTSIQTASILKAAHFNVNTSQAGIGQLEVVVVTAGGIPVPVTVKNLGVGIYDVGFTPQLAETHEVSVKFNGVDVAGSPFHVSVIDGSKATASGPGLEMAKLNVPTSFDVITNNPPSSGATLEVIITSPKGQFVQSHVTPSSVNTYHVEYVPKDPGSHKIVAKFAGVGIRGSPFAVPVFDSSLVRVNSISQGIVGRSVTFDVDATRCGFLDGTLEVEIKGQRTRPTPQVSSSKGHFGVSFVATECVPHVVSLNYAGERVVGSPMTVNFIDPKSMHVKWDAVCRRPIHSVVSFELEVGEENVAALMNGSDDNDVAVMCSVREATGRSVPSRIKKGSKSYQMEFTPFSVGAHTIEVHFGNTVVPGTPHVCHVYDASRVLISEVSLQNQIGKEAGFVVDASKAGQGEVKVQVMSSGAEIVTQSVQMSDSVTRYTFVPVQAVVHVATVRFNSEAVSGSPVNFQVTNPANQLNLVSLSPSGTVAIGEPIMAYLVSETIFLNPSSFKAEAKASSGEIQNVSTSVELDGCFRFTYLPKSAGKYKLDVSCFGTPVSGSPLVTEVFDPSKVVVEAQKTGTVGQPVSFDVIVTGAGNASLDVAVFDSKNSPLVLSNQILSYGNRMTYVPLECGLHTISVLFGGLDVPGTPIHQQISDNFSPLAHGDGLVTGVEGNPSEFVVDTTGRCGNLDVRVEGPRSMAAVKIENDEINKVAKVSYTPIENGRYTVTIKWDGKEISGSPFMVKVSSPSRVKAVGGWDSLLDELSRLSLVVDEKKCFDLDCSDAGPGQLRINTTGPDGLVPTDVIDNGDSTYRVAFVPRHEGDYSIRMYYNENPVEKFPINGTAVRFIFNQRQAPPCPTPPVAPVQPPPPPVVVTPAKPCVASGLGLSMARVDEAAEFYVLSSSPKDAVAAHIIGFEEEIPVTPVETFSDFNLHKFFYTPKRPGPYLIYLTCNGNPIEGSPFRVLVPQQKQNPVLILPPLPPPPAPVQPPPPVQPAPVQPPPPHQLPRIVLQPECTNADIGQAVITVGKDKKAEFVVDGVVVGDPVVDCRGPTGPVRVLISQETNSRYRCSFYPPVSGIYFLAISAGGIPICGSPFSLNVIDNDDYMVTDVFVRPYADGPGLNVAYVGQEAEFTLDAAFCEPKITMVGTSGDITVQAVPIADGTYRCTYIPHACGVYLMTISCGDYQVIGSPFKVTVGCDEPPPELPAPPAKIPIAIGPGLSDANVNKVAEFLVDGACDVPTIKMTGVDDDIDVLPVMIGENRFKCSYTPKYPGVYLLSIVSCGSQVQGSPFKVVVPAVPQAVLPSPQPVPAPVPAPQPAPAPALPPSPLLCPVVIGPGLRSARLHEVAEFLVDGCRDGEPRILLTGMSGNVPVQIMNVGGGRYKCLYTIEEPGVYLLNISYKSCDIEGSPFRIVVEPLLIPVIKKVTTIRGIKDHSSSAATTSSGTNLPFMTPVASGEGLHTSVVNQTSEFEIDSASADPEIMMSSSGSDVFVRCLKVADNKYKCSYVTYSPGIYVLSISIRGIQIPGSPFRVLSRPDPADKSLTAYYDPFNQQIILPQSTDKVSSNAYDLLGTIAKKPTLFSAAQASGSGLTNAFINSPSEFTVTGCKEFPTAHLFGDSGEVITVDFQKLNEGNFKGSYVVRNPGTYLLTLVCSGSLIAGSPFKINVPAQIHPVENLKLRDTVKSVSSSASAVIQTVAKKLQATAQNVKAIGEGLSTAFLQKRAEFVVDASNAGNGRLHAELIGLSNKVEVTCKPLGDNRFSCSYKPKVQGAYLLNVTWADHPIPGSPFKVTVNSSTDTSKVTISGEALQSGGSIGTPINVMVDATKAGKDDLKATCQGPNNFVNCKIEEVTAGRYNVSFTPLEAGSYVLNVTYAGVVVTGCPATIKINGTVDASKVVVTGEGLKDGVLATFKSTFSIETKGAGPGQLNVRMRGKKDTFKIEMKRDTTNPRTIHCKFNPSEVGLYILDVKWSAQSVPGSPFKIHVFDTTQELNQFKASGGNEELFGFNPNFGVDGRSSLKSNGGYNLDLY